MRHLRELDVAMRSLPGPDGSNQDAAYSQMIDGGHILMIADGMGGPQGGAAASATAASVMEELMEEEFEDVKEWVDFAFGETNQRILNHTRLDPGMTGMGTTMTVVVLWENTLHVGHVGDTRLYRLRREILDQLTTDHTLLGPWKLDGRNGGTAVREQAGLNQALTRSVGGSEDVYPDYFRIDVATGDVLLMCTDGLHRLVTGKEMKGALVAKDPEEAVDALIEMAQRRGLMDDITVLVARVE